jgi:hypothetical protein
MILAGGAVAFVVGVFLLILCFNQFLTVLLGLIPVILLVGGAFAAYSGYDEWKEKRKGESEEFEPTFETRPAETPAEPRAFGGCLGHNRDGEAGEAKGRKDSQKASPQEKGGLTGTVQ